MNGVASMGTALAAAITTAAAIMTGAAMPGAAGMAIATVGMAGAVAAARAVMMSAMVMHRGARRLATIMAAVAAGPVAVAVRPMSAFPLPSRVLARMDRRPKRLPLCAPTGAVRAANGALAVPIADRAWALRLWPHRARPGLKAAADLAVGRSMPQLLRRVR